MSDKKEPLNCEHCQKEFRSKSGLANHIKFCKEKKWNPTELTVGQMLIVTRQEDYQNPKI